MNTKKWDSLSDQERDDLLDWFNVEITCITKSDKRRLAELLRMGRFWAWNCPQCGDRVYYAEPKDWSHFQGANQADYFSYPGSKYQGERRRFQLCDKCRLHCFETDDTLKLTGTGEPSCWPEDDCHGG